MAAALLLKAGTNYDDSIIPERRKLLWGTSDTAADLGTVVPRPSANYSLVNTRWIYNPRLLHCVGGTRPAGWRAETTDTC